MVYILVIKLACKFVFFEISKLSIVIKMNEYLEKLMPIFELKLLSY